jgi:hypothetical protein
MLFVANRYDLHGCRVHYVIKHTVCPDTQLPG